jgi:uncharacterized membrane protein
MFFKLKLLSALGCGQPTASGIATMQSINATAINPWFMTAFLGTGTSCLFLTISSLLKWYQPGASYLLIGSLLYLVGTVLVTAALNVPLNNALAIVKPDSPEGADFWAKYLTTWTFWNHVRTVAALAAAALLTLAIGD